MRRIFITFIAFTTVFCLLSLNASAGKLSKVGFKKAKGPSLGYLLRDDLKQQFKSVMTAYFAEDKTSFLGYFADNLTMAGRTLYGKKAKITKSVLDKKVSRDFARQDFTKVNFDEAFDLNSPTMLFVLSEEQMHDSIPVWGFSISAREITPYMKPGDFLVIANTLPDVFDKVSMPSTVYIIFRKVAGKLVAVGMD